MKDWKKFLGVLLAFLGVTFFPALGNWVATGAAPPGYGAFPARFVHAPPGFNLIYFIGFSVFALFVLLFLVFPRWFGFKKAPPAPNPAPAKYPWWFWLGIPVTVISWALMWSRLHVPVSFEHYAFVPLAWGFIAVLDGLVFKRTGGRSLMATKPTTFKVMILISCLSWFLFEYINFFVRENWYYPNATIFSDFGIIVWFFLGYTCVLTGIFEWYSLLRTLPRFSVRYSLGPRINPGKTIGWIVLLLGLALAFLMGYFPYPMFWGIWVSLVPVLGAALILAGKRTLLNDIGERGDWTKVNLSAVATLLNGIFWELWNFGSAWFHPEFPTTPGFWRYSVPYVDVIHLFSEMPLLGYWGYLFFGVNCWILWNLASYFFGFDDDVEVVTHSP
jgi:hypothetical protein